MTMLIHETRLRIHAPLDRVLSFLDDPGRWPAYSEKARRIEVIGHAPERIRVSGHMGPRAFTADLEITRYPEAGLAFEQLRGDTPFVRGHFLATLEDGFTVLTHREEWRFERSWIERFWAPRLRGIAERETDRIKQHVEWAFVSDLLHGRPLEPTFRVTWWPVEAPEAVPRR